MARQQFSIGEVARQTGYSTEQIRRLERDHHLIKPVRVGGYRVFTERDIAVINRWRQARNAG